MPDSLSSADTDVPVVLLTRPLDGSERVAQQLAESGLPHRLVVSPILGIDLIPLSGLVDNDCTLILSSQHAASALKKSEQAIGQRAYCVGDATAEAAEAIGLKPISAQGTSTELAALIAADRPKTPLVWIRGETARPELPEALADLGISMSEQIGYRQIPQVLTEEATNALTDAKRVIIPLYSPRSAELVSAATSPATADRDAVFISQVAADAWVHKPPNFSTIAASPTGPDMLRALLCRVAAGRAG